VRTTDPIRRKMLEAALARVAFDGWGKAAFDAARADTGISPEIARASCPRGALDLAVEYHRRGDSRMVAALAGTDLSEMRFRDRVTHAVRLRLESEDREIVRRSAALFSLPINAPEGAKLIWETSDAIWTALNDRSEDANWYTKRTILAGVFGSVMLFWLGDESEGAAESWAFLDRRIENVMGFEKIKAGLRKAPFLGAAMNRMEASLRAPRAGAIRDAPGAYGHQE